MLVVSSPGGKCFTPATIMKIIAVLFSGIRFETIQEILRLNRGWRWVLMYLSARFRLARMTALGIKRLVSAFQAKPPQSTLESIFEELNVEEAVSSLRLDGFFSGVKLSGQVLADLLEFARSNPCFAGGDLNSGFFYANKDIAQTNHSDKIILARYYNITDLPSVQRLVNDPKLVSIATKFLGCIPLNSENRLWWSFAENVPEEERFKYAQSLHFDLEDYRCLRFFFYLTDVGEFDGPHVCVRGSHNRKKLSHLLSIHRRKNEPDVIDYYGNHNVVTITGSAGFGFAEDPFCMHKGLTPVLHNRLILQIQYSMNCYGSGSDLRNPALFHLI
jgi:hypothetical protein